MIRWIDRQSRQRFKQELAVWRIAALPGFTIIGLVVVLRLAGLLQPLEWWAFDLMLRSRPSEPTDERILIVGIDEADIQAVGTYPIPDGQLAALIEKLQTYQPNSIGFDLIRDLPVEPGHAQLAQVFQKYENIIGIKKALNPIVKAPPELPPAQVGFADLIFDRDNALRRALIGTPIQSGYSYSLSLLLAERYLNKRQLVMEQGNRDPEAMRFGTTEFDRFHANSGSYIDADDRGYQFLINYRSGKMPFHVVSMADVMQGNVPADLIRDRIVLIGMTAISAGDLQRTDAVANSISGSIYGVEAHAHIASQMLSAVLDGRSWISVWPEKLEYLWIISWGVLSISLARFSVSPTKTLLSLGFTSFLLVGIGYVALIAGWWLTVAPPLFVIGAGLTTSLFYRHQQDLQARLRDRQLVIEQTYTAIHNIPVQTLKSILGQVRQKSISQSELCFDLERLEQELRSIEESVRQEAVAQSEHLYLCGGTRLDLQHPIHQLLHSVYRSTLTRTRDFPRFETVIKIVSFEEIENRRLTTQQKQGLCRFIEEALCNAGKYAEGMTRLEVGCKLENGWNTIRIADNGKGIQTATRRGYGSRQAVSLARQLGGKFQRISNSPKGTICELTYPVSPFWLWSFLRKR